MSKKTKSNSQDVGQVASSPGPEAEPDEKGLITMDAPDGRRDLDGLILDHEFNGNKSLVAVDSQRLKLPAASETLNQAVLDRVRTIWADVTRNGSTL